MNIEPYKSFGSLILGKSKRDDCVRIYGEPISTRKNREGVVEYHYDTFIIRFSPTSDTVQECTLLPQADATIAGIDVTWDKDFLQCACEHDGSPKNVYGFIVLTNLGIAVTGFHDEDESQMAVTVFSDGSFDDLLRESVPYEFKRGESR